MIVNNINPILMPILSRKIPPNKGKIIFGNEYTVYNKDHCEFVKS